MKLKDIAHPFHALSRKGRRRRSSTAVPAPLSPTDPALAADFWGTPPRSPLSVNSQDRGSLRLPSSARHKGSYLGSKRSRRKLSITISAENDGRRLLKLRRRKESQPLQIQAKPVSTNARSRPTSWATVSTTRSPDMSPNSLSPRSTSHPIPLELYADTESDTAIVTPTSILTPVNSHGQSLSSLGNTKSSTEARAEAGTACVLERLWTPADLERKPSATKKPAPGRVYVFDVVSEESATPASPTTPEGSAAREARTARLAQSAQRAPLAFRTSPWSRVVSDLVFLVSHLNLLPRMFVPCRRHGPSASADCVKVNKGGRGTSVETPGAPVPTLNCRGHITDATLTQALLFILSIVVTVLGFGSLVACMPTVFALLGLVFLAEAIQGPKTRDSNRPDVESVPGSDREAWFFVNGMAGTGNGAQEIIDHLHGLVRRPVTALMNRSLGLWFDLLQSILQRNLFLPTRDLRNGYKYVHEAIMNSSLDRIVLVAHSQGGIIVSAWVDQLIADLPPSLLTRIEVYTFGSAASHFALRADGEGAFARVEHFANMHDLVARFGVLHHARGGSYAPSRPDEGVGAVYGRYVGRVFARNRTGHMLLDHYLHPSDSILNEPSVKSASRFAGYVGGGHVLDAERKTSAPSSVSPMSPPRKDARSQLGHGTPTASTRTPTKAK